MTQNNLFRNKKELSQFINREIFNIIKKYGYKKNAGNFYLEKGELTVLIDIQKAKYNVGNKEEFTLNWNLIFSPISSYFYNEVVPKKPSLKCVMITGRVTDLKKEKFDRWWILSLLSTQDEINTILEEIKLYINDYAIPFLAKLNNINDVIAMLETIKCGSSFYTFYPSQNDPKVSQAILYLFIDEKDKSLAIMDQVITETTSDLYRDSMRRLKTKIQDFDPTQYLQLR